MRDGVNTPDRSLARFERVAGAGSVQAAAAPGRTARSPFATRPPAGAFWFETEALNAALAQAVRAAEGDGPAVLVEGETGAGKTSFLMRLAQLDRNVETCFINAHQPLGEAHLGSRIAAAFGFGIVRDAGELAALLAGRAAAGTFPLILVDDAQHLTPFGLRLLLDLRREVLRHGGRLGLVVSAPPGALRRVLALPSFAAWGDGAFVRLEVPAFSIEETGDYLARIIEIAGMQSEVAFDATQVASLHKAAHGLPGQIDRLADGLLRGARPRPFRKRAPDRRVRYRPARSRRSLGWPVAALGLVLGSAGYLGYAVFLAEPGASTGTDAAAVSEGVLDSGFALPQALDAPVTAAEEPLEAPRSAAPETMPATSAGPAAAPPAVATPNPSPGAQGSGARAPAAPAPASTATLSDRGWLMAQEPGRFTIQLASTPERDKALEFIEKHPLQGRTAAIETLRGSRTWYVVVHGSFGSSAEASRAIEALPPNLRRNDPFARRFESVQAMAVGG